ncbi:MAG: DUF1993 domain-containing protein [Bdellovibrionaceae bacterium]|nr:DUF1993 domain-containing protein [Bdellovibrio sp.]
MLYEMTIPQFTKMLRNLNNILGKAATFAEIKKIDMDVLMQSRLAPDQFNLAKQIQIACDTAKLFAARMAGKDAPVHDDKETTYPQMKTRIEDVISYLSKFSAADFADANERKITQPRWEGKYVTGFEYASQHATPNLYFHITTAYAILRHNGVEVGKKDFLGEMPYKT